MGRIDYINNLPFFTPFDRKKIQWNGTWHKGSPSECNRLLKEEKLPMALVSSAFYLKNKKKLQRFSPFCVAAKAAVLSVALFSRCGIENLHKKNILITPESFSSYCLLKVLCEKFYGIYPQYIQKNDQSTQYDAFVVIGDKALKMPLLKGYRKYDLAHVWKEKTQLPFVFGLFACGKSPQAKKSAKEFSYLLQKAYAWSCKNPKIIYEEARKRVDLPLKTIENYFSKLSYQLDAAMLESLELFDTLSFAYQ